MIFKEDLAGHIKCTCFPASLPKLQTSLEKQMKNITYIQKGCGVDIFVCTCVRLVLTCTSLQNALTTIWLNDLEAGVSLWKYFT